MLENIDPAPLDDVLIEQFEYLLNHRTCAVMNCRDCMRKRIVSAALMEPFSRPEREPGLPVLRFDEHGCVVGGR